MFGKHTVYGENRFVYVCAMFAIYQSSRVDLGAHNTYTITAWLTRLTRQDKVTITRQNNLTCTYKELQLWILPTNRSITSHCWQNYV